MSTADFIEGARLLGAGVGGGIDEHPTKWRLVVRSRTQPALVLPFDTEAEVRSAFEVERGRELVAEWTSITIEHPDGFTPPPPRRLPIYGETAEDRRSRDLIDSWRFGQWLLANRRRITRFDMLIDFIDHEQDPYNVSLQDIEKRLAWWHRRLDKWHAGELTDEFGDEDDGASEPEEGRCLFESEHGYDLDDLVEVFGQARAEWLRREARLEEGEDHSCHVVLTPIDAPRTGGVYFVWTTAPVHPGHVKIGFSSTSIKQRLADLQCSHPWPLALLAVEHGVGRNRERELHREFKSLRVRANGEWFLLTGRMLQHLKNLRACS